MFFLDRNSLHDAARGGEWFSKDSVLVNYFVRDWQKIRDWQTQKLSMRSVASNYPEHGPTLAMTRISRPA